MIQTVKIHQFESIFTKNKKNHIFIAKKKTLFLVQKTPMQKTGISAFFFLNP